MMRLFLILIYVIVKIFLPISLMIRAQDGVGYFNCAHGSAYIQTMKEGFVIAARNEPFAGRECICLFGRI